MTDYYLKIMITDYSNNQRIKKNYYWNVVTDPANCRYSSRFKIW